MSPVLAEERSGGYEALATGDWSAARAAFEEAVVDRRVAGGAGRPGSALWWLRDGCGAIVSRERAYAGS